MYWRFQCSRSVKHWSHLFYLTRIPVWEVSFLKFRCSRKHTFHIRYTTRIRYFNLLYQSTFKHTIHIFYLPSISNTYTRYFWTPEHERHIFHIACISEMYWRFQCSRSVKHWSHCCHITRINISRENNVFYFKTLKKRRCIIRKLYSRSKLNLANRVDS